MSSRTIAIEIYADQTAADTAAAEMGLPPRNFTDVLIKTASRIVNYDNFVSDTAETTLATASGSLWLVVGSK